MVENERKLFKNADKKSKIFGDSLVSPLISIAIWIMGWQEGSFLKTEERGARRRHGEGCEGI